VGRASRWAEREVDAADDAGKGAEDDDHPGHRPDRTVTASAGREEGADDALVRRTLRLPPEPASARRVRELLREVLTGAGRQDCLDAAELACTELVTNAFLHAHTDAEVTVEVRDHVRVEVRDFNPNAPLQRHYGVQATTGRGLALVAAVSDDHGISDVGPEGKTLWFTVGGGAAPRTDADVLAAWDSADWDVQDWPAARAPAMRSVTLRQVPPTLWLAAQQHHDALLRELAFYRTRHDLPLDIAGADRARQTVSAAVRAELDRARSSNSLRPALPAGHPSPLPPVPPPFDVTIDVTTTTGADAAALQDVLDAAEALASAGRLLARPGLPEVIALRDWACEQVVAQLAGVPPAPWTGAEQERFADEIDVGAARRLESFTATVRDSPRRVVAADDANRIVAISHPLADALGWEVDGLVGRRIVALIPPELREAHVAGFTRHLTTGQAHALGVPLVLPVLRADGSQVPCRFLIEASHPVPGRSIYVAWIDPVEES
jgi:PAS domain S-box-containing protein